MKQTMLLVEWERLTDRSAFLFAPNTFYIPDTIGLQDSELRPLLWQLKDFTVSSVTGGTIWLVRK
jgi:hypothetical protein